MDELNGTIDPAILEQNINALHDIGNRQYNAPIFLRPDLSANTLQHEKLPYIDAQAIDDQPIETVPHQAFEPAIATNAPVDQPRSELQATWPRCPSDPLTRYQHLQARLASEGNTMPEPGFFLRRELGIREIYNSSFFYGLRLGGMLQRLDKNTNYDQMLLSTIAHGPEWLWRTPGYPLHLGRGIEGPGEKAHFRTLLDRFEVTIEMLSELRIHCILMFGFDVKEQIYHVPTANLETSDSCDSENDGNDAMYEITRTALEKFQRDPLKEWIQVNHYGNQGLRKDIRAWARLTRCGCMKLPDGTMLLHKHKKQIPRRPRKKIARPASPPPRPYDHFQDRIYMPSYNGDPSSGESSAGSGESMDSITNGHKRRRLPTVEGGYPCTSCNKTFDRQCDLAHHSRSHLNVDTRPYGCESCDKRFNFPKDLRRHERRIHRIDDATSEDRSS